MEASLITSTSKAWKVWAHTLARVASSVPAPLYTGTTTDTRGNPVGRAGSVMERLP